MPAAWGEETGRKVDGGSRRVLLTKSGRRGAAALFLTMLALPLTCNAQALTHTTKAPPVGGGSIGPFERGYPVKPRPDAGRGTSAGWSLFATAQGRSRVLGDGGGWTEDPQARPGEVLIGYGWRRRNISATLGYAQQPVSAPVDPWRRPRQQGLVGVSVALRSR